MLYLDQSRCYCAKMQIAVGRSGVVAASTSTFFVALLLLLTTGCGDDGGGGGVDGGGGDAAIAADASVGLPSTCAGACATTALTATLGGTTEPFTKGYFGLTSPAQAGGSEWEIYIEVSDGGDGLCPTEQAPIPDRLFIASKIPVPGANPAPLSATVNIVDFKGTLLPNTPTTAATENTVTWVAADPCVACSEGSVPDRVDRFVAIDVSATFQAGTAMGHIYATHCDSLDDL